MCQLAETMLKEDKELDFLIMLAAHHLLDVVSRSNHEWLSCLNLNSEEEQVDDGFSSLPDWLKDEVNDIDLMLPWLPVSQKLFNMAMQFSSCGENDDPMTEFEEDKQEIMDEVIEEVDEVAIKEVDEYLNTQVEQKAEHLKEQFLSLQSTAKAVELAGEIQQLCRGGGQSLAILGIIEPWRADDETAAVLVSNLQDGDEDELGWPSHVLCSVILPELLVLKEPASHVLLAATVEYSKVHQRTAEYALLLPLMLRTEGINSPICDVITRIVRESLHPGHVSAFCRELLSDEVDLKKFICLPCHQCLIGSKLVRKESLFSLCKIS